MTHRDSKVIPERIIDWNKERYEQEFDKDLTHSLLTEEVQELLDSTTTVDTLDALVDIIYVSIGAIWKLGLSAQQINEAILVVCDSNDSKTVVKTPSHIKTNINKGASFIPPEPRLAAILQAAFVDELVVNDVIHDTRPKPKESDATIMVRSTEIDEYVGAYTATIMQARERAAELAVNQAALSPCEKRKVGAVIIDQFGTILAMGHNYNTLSDCGCENPDGTTRNTVMHAEVVAINKLAQVKVVHKDKLEIFVTHEPCDNCLKTIIDVGITTITVLKQFLKFDQDKPRFDLISPEFLDMLAAGFSKYPEAKGLRYELIPFETLLGIAMTLTKGAKKYKPDNWKEVDDINRYVRALMGHINDYRKGDLIDDGHMGSGDLHSQHALTNACFLHYFDYLKLTENKNEQ